MQPDLTHLSGEEPFYENIILYKQYVIEKVVSIYMVTQFIERTRNSMTHQSPTTVSNKIYLDYLRVKVPVLFLFIWTSELLKFIVNKYLDGGILFSLQFNVIILLLVLITVCLFKYFSDTELEESSYFAWIKISLLFSVSGIVVSSLFHQFNNYDVLSIYNMYLVLKSLFFNKVFSTVVSFVLFTMILLSYLKNNDVIDYVIKAYVYFISFTSFIYIVLIFLYGYGFLEIFSLQVFSNNSKSFESLSAIVMLILYLRKKISARLFVVLLYMNTFLIFLNASRGASFVLFVVVMMSTIFNRHELLNNKFNKRFILQILLLLLMLIPITDYDPIKYIKSSFVPEFSVAFENDYNAAPNLLEGTIGTYNYFQHDFYQPSYKKDSGNLYCDRDLIDYSYISDSESIISIYSRIGTNFIAYEAFRDSVIFGVGFDKAYQICFGSAGIHSFWFLILAALGLVGILPLATVGVIYFYRTVRVNPEVSMITFCSVVSILLLENQIPISIAIIMTIMISKISRASEVY